MGQDVKKALGVDLVEGGTHAAFILFGWQMDSGNESVASICPRESHHGLRNFDGVESQEGRRVDGAYSVDVLTG